MKQMNNDEVDLLDVLEQNVERMNILCTLLTLFDETDPFACSATPPSGNPRRKQAALFLRGLHDLAEYYQQDLRRAVQARYSAG